MSWMETFSQLTGFDFSGSSEKLSTSPDPIQSISQTSATQTTSPAAQSYGVTNTPANSSQNYDQAISDINRHILGIWERENLYPQTLGSGSERSDADLWRHIDVNIWGKEYVDQHTGKITAANPSALVPQFTKMHEGQESRLSDAKAHRDEIERKVDQGIAEHQKFWDELGILHEKHVHQEGRISDHTHNGTTNGLDWYIELALVAAGTFLVYFIIRRKFLR